MSHPLVIGHAAAAGEAPPNTLAGVAACLRGGADAMEIDLRLSADGIPVLIHDDTLDRTTDRSGRVRDFTAAELARSDAGCGEPVPTLRQVLELAAGRLTVMCELKSARDDPPEDAQLVDAALDVIAGAGAERWTAIHSFEPDIVRRARERQPLVSTALIHAPPGDGGIHGALDRALGAGAQALSLHHASIDSAGARASHLRQLTLWAWTADTAEDWQRLIAAGVDGIITNVPSKLREYLRIRRA